MRELGVRLKHSANRAVVAGKRIVLIDDSIVRGTTSVKIVQMMREAGAREVHFRISSPPITHPDYYGIDTPEREKLLAATHTLEEMRDFIGCDSLAFLSVDGIYRAMGDERPRPDAPAIHRPLLHRRLSDPPHRSHRRDEEPALAAGRSQLDPFAVSPPSPPSIFTAKSLLPALPLACAGARDQLIRSAWLGTLRRGAAMSLRLRSQFRQPVKRQFRHASFPSRPHRPRDGRLARHRPRRRP